jgi:hypothetical protein
MPNPLNNAGRMPGEADTSRRFVVPKLLAAGWDSDPHSIAEQRYFTDGRIIVRGNKAERKRGKRTQQRRPGHVTTTSFQSQRAENHRASAMRLVLCKRPSLKNLS